MSERGMREGHTRVADTLTVHEVGLAAAIRTNDAGEIEEGSDALFARVGLEVFEFQVGHRHLLGLEREFFRW